MAGRTCERTLLRIARRRNHAVLLLLLELLLLLVTMLLREPLLMLRVRRVGRRDRLRRERHRTSLRLLRLRWGNRNSCASGHPIDADSRARYPSWLLLLHLALILHLHLRLRLRLGVFTRLRRRSTGILSVLRHPLLLLLHGEVVSL